VIALIVGPDAATARAEVERLLRTHDPSGLNTTRLDGKAISLDEAVNAVGTPAFFGGGRVVVVDDLMARASKSGQSGSDPSEASDETTGSRGLEFGRLFGAVAGENVLILVDQGLGAVPAAVKKAAPGNSLVFGGEPPRGAALIEWIQRAAVEAGSSIDPRTARLLAGRTFPQTWSAKPSNPAYDRPPDLDLLRNEIAKLALAAHPAPIDAELVEEMVVSAAEDRLFPFVEAVVTNRLDEAVPALESLQATGDDPGRLVAQVYQQIELAAILPAAGTTTDPAAVGKDLGLTNPNRMIGVSKTLRRSRMAPAQLLQLAIETDRQSKRGGLRHGDDVVYHLLTLAVAPVATEANQRGGTECRHCTRLVETERSIRQRQFGWPPAD
jgi:DNA polymerase III delta subunit